jgi:hypothetical protein
MEELRDAQFFQRVKTRPVTVLLVKAGGLLAKPGLEVFD